MVVDFKQRVYFNETGFSEGKTNQVLLPLTHITGLLLFHYFTVLNMVPILALTIAETHYFQVPKNKLDIICYYKYIRNQPIVSSG